MPRRPSTDPNKAAFDLIQKIIDSGEKNPAAVALGKLGGSKGGKIRAAKLSARRRSEIAKKAAATRWGKKS
ncbi:MAG: hypothetical protein E6H84_10160 [Chloroflexi bacterium]|nr:MAG: hypothetical protein E6H84_10160 [Chloroflexota bacterium]